MALISISVIPFGTQLTIGPYTTMMQLADVNVGILFILAISSMGVYGIALGGWASNNKYALLGGLRSSAQMISYELPMSLAIASPLLIAGTSEPARDRGFAGGLQLRHSFPNGRSSPVRFRRSSASSFS